MTGTRPSWDEYYLGIAQAVSARADCTRRQVGAVLVQDHRIVSTGYNGAPSGQPGCLSAGACPRGRHYPAKDDLMTGFQLRDKCACGNSWPCPDAVDPSSSYDTGPGACISVHAEANALLYANRADCVGATLYCTDRPCDGCMRLILAAGIAHIRSPKYWLN
jgi:dCMP deaminase